MPHPSATSPLLKAAESYLSALHGSVARHDNLAANLGCAGCELRDRIRTALTAPQPAVWAGGDPLMEAIAAAVWERCAHDDEDIPQLVLDDPRTIAATAASVVRASADRAALRDRIAAALYERERPPREPRWPDAYAADREVFEAMADAVLVVLPEPADRPAVLSEAERKMLAYALDQAQEHIWSRDGFTDEDQASVTSLRRLAAEAPTTTAMCGRTRDISGNEYPPCRRAPGHGEAYCRSADGNAYFLAINADQPAAGVRQNGAQPS